MQNQDRERVLAWWGEICNFLQFISESKDMMQAYYESRLALRCSKNILQAVQPCFDSSEGIEFREWDFLIHDQLEILSGHLETIHASLKRGYALDANSQRALDWLAFNWRPTAENLHRLILDSKSIHTTWQRFSPMEQRAIGIYSESSNETKPAKIDGIIQYEFKKPVRFTKKGCSEAEPAKWENGYANDVIRLAKEAEVLVKRDGVWTLATEIQSKKTSEASSDVS